jgi:hypothetical protein
MYIFRFIFSHFQPRHRLLFACFGLICGYLIQNQAVAYAQTPDTLPSLPHIYINEKQGLVSGVVYEIALDRLGRVCGASNAGAFCFDGRNTVSFTPENGLTANEMLRIKPDSVYHLLLLGFSGSLDGVRNDSVFNLVPAAHMRDFAIDAVRSGDAYFMAAKTSGVFLSTSGRWEPWAGVRVRNLSVFEKAPAVFDLQGKLVKIEKDRPASEEVATSDSRAWVKTSEWMVRSIGNTLLAHNFKEGISLQVPLSFQPNVLHIDGMYLYAAGDEECVQFGLSAGHIDPVARIKTRFPVSSIISDDAGGVLASTLGGGVLWIPEPDARFLPFPYTALVTHSGQNLLSATSTGDALLFDGKTTSFKRLPFDDKPDPGHPVRRVITSGQLVFWLSDRSVLVTDSSLNKIAEIKSLVKDLAVRNDTIQLAMIQGFVQLPVTGFLALDGASSQSANETLKAHLQLPVRIDHLGSGPHRITFAASGNQLLRLHSSGRVIETDTLGGWITALTVSPDSNRVWITTTGAGVYEKNVHYTGLSRLTVSGATSKSIAGMNGRPEWIQQHRIYGETGLKAAPAEGLTSENIFDHMIWNNQRVVAGADGVFLLKAEPRIMQPPRFSDGGQVQGDLVWRQPVVYRPVVSHVQSAGLRTLQIRLSPEMNWQTIDEAALRYDLLSDGHYQPQFRVILNERADTTLFHAAAFTIAPPWWRWNVTRLTSLLLLCALTVAIIKRQVTRIQERAALKQQVFDLTLMNLKAQLKPHFVFNALNAVRHLVMSDQRDPAVRYLTTFSKLLRSALQHNEALTVTLEQEFTLAEQYLQLERLRLDESFSYSISVSPDIHPHSVEIPSFILQPILENAIWHGLQHQKEGNKSIIIAATIHGGALCISITDSGSGPKPGPGNTHTGKGLYLVDTKLRLFMQQTRKPAVRENSVSGMNGYTVTVRIALS